MSKYNDDDSLNYSITYMPFFLLQYNDTNENGLFDVGLSTPTSGEVDYDLLDYHESIYAMYPFAPILPWIFEGDTWNWTVTDLVDQPITMNALETHAYSWNISATLPAFPWMWKWGWEDGGESTIDVEFRYTIVFYPTGPEVKYDFHFSDADWMTPDAKLAMESIVVYVGEQSPIVKADGWSWKTFHDTQHLLDPQVTIAEDVEDTVLAWTLTYENATVDRGDNVQSIAWAIQPTFLIPIGLHPHGTYFDGVAPTGTYTMGFIQQLGLPHFEEYVAQDPVIGLAAPLFTVTLPFHPGDLLSLTTIVAATILVTVGFVLYTQVRRPSRLGPHR
jgi:hypothetical protein